MSKDKKKPKRNRILLPLIIIFSGFVLGVLFAEYTKDGLKIHENEGILWPYPPKLNEFFLIDKDNQPFTLDDFKDSEFILWFFPKASTPG